MIGVLAEGRRPAVPAGGVGIPAARGTRLHNLVQLATQMAERTAQGLTAAQESLDRGVLSVTSRRQAERFRATDRGVVDIVVEVAHARASTREGGELYPTRHRRQVVDGRAARPRRVARSSGQRPPTETTGEPEFLRWLGSQTSQHTGAPLSISFRRSIVTLITRFVTETAAWEWDDVPARVLFTRADIPKINHPVPRFIPDHELAALMSAVDQLPDPYQRAALIVARWSGARRDEIRRLALDCLDADPDGHPGLRIPVGKGYAERMIPLHPQAAEALQPVIDLARQQQARRRFDPSAGRQVQHVFLVRG